MGDLMARLEEMVCARGLIRRGEQILVAVSGGVDSMVLLHLLHDFAAANRWKLAVAHFNHQLRGRSSDADERLVRRTAAAFGLKVIVGRGNVRAFAKRQGLSLEMAARQLRHEFLALATRRMKFRLVALAHHADDQVELFFLRLLRGAGSEGLAGMKRRAPSPVDPHVELVRPLLEVSKRELEDFARSRRVRFREDASNAALDILRNRLRQELLPLLKRRYQPALAPAVSRAMNILSEESEVISGQARAWLQAENPAAFETLPVAVQRRVLLQELQHLELPAEFETVETLRRRADVAVSVGPGVSVERAESGLLRVHAADEPEFREAAHAVSLSPGSGVTQFSGVRVRWRNSAKRGADLPNPAPKREMFDADRVGSRITLRHWRPGDRFQPIGMKQAAKLQDLFTNAKIPALRRRELIVAETEGGQIFWVEGLRIGEVSKLRAGTRRRLEWKWGREGLNEV